MALPQARSMTGTANDPLALRSTRWVELGRPCSGMHSPQFCSLQEHYRNKSALPDQASGYFRMESLMEEGTLSRMAFFELTSD